MPAPNTQRRNLLADAAIAILARDGAHGLTHRSVERQARLPTGTASNYFPTRDLLFDAAARRIGDQHARGMDEAEDAAPTRRSSGEGRLVDLLTESLLDAATRDRDRYLAVFELQAESLRRPALAESLQVMQRSLAAFTRAHHRRLGLTIDARRIPMLMELYGAVLHNLVLRPEGSVDRAAVRPLVRAIVRGTLSTADS